MSFLTTVAESEAAGLVAEQYEKARKANGYLPNYVAMLSNRPEVHDAWSRLILTIRANLDLRRYELVTLAAARTLRSDRRA
ncbi:MAG: hypothetical protein ACT4OP_04835 [Actinomycetota bacterium]